MTYPTYDDARVRERELLRLAQRQTVGSEPRRERSSIFRVNGLLTMWRRRHARTVAIGRA